jgi:hypothetical protein
MANLLPIWTQLLEAFGVVGAAALVIYAVVGVAALVGVIIESAIAVRRWWRARAVGRELQAIHDAAYRERPGGRRA